MSAILRRSPRAIAFVLLSVLATIGPAVARPLAPNVESRMTESERVTALKARGDRAQALADRRQRLWDGKMKAVSGSVCIGC